MSGPYRRVPAEESAASSTASAAPRQQHSSLSSASSSYSAAAAAAEAEASTGASATAGGRTAAERVSDKVHALLWMGAAFAVARFTDFFPILLGDPRVLRPVLHAALALLGLNTVLTLYLAVYLPWVLGIRDPSAWDAYCPRVIPTITGAGVACGLLLIRSLWPVWGFLTPLVLGVEGLGMFFSLHFLPWL